MNQDEWEERPYTAEERERLQELDGALEAWAEAAAERVALPEGEAVDPSSRARGWGWIALAAAAAGVVLVTDPGGAVREGGVEAPRGVALEAAELEVGSDDPFMVVPTRNPDIAVVWILNSGD